MCVCEGKINYSPCNETLFTLRLTNVLVTVVNYLDLTCCLFSSCNQMFNESAMIMSHGRPVTLSLFSWTSWILFSWCCSLCTKDKVMQMVLRFKLSPSLFLIKVMVMHFNTGHPVSTSHRMCMLNLSTEACKTHMRGVWRYPALNLTRLWVLQ